MFSVFMGTKYGNGYFISVGYSLVEGNEDLEETIKKSDKAMYEDKALFYK